MLFLDVISDSSRSGTSPVTVKVEKDMANKVLATTCLFSEFDFKEVEILTLIR